MDVVETIGKTKTDNGDKPLKRVVVADSGILPLSAPFDVSDDPHK